MKSFAGLLVLLISLLAGEPAVAKTLPNRASSDTIARSIKEVVTIRGDATIQPDPLMTLLTGGTGEPIYKHDERMCTGWIYSLPTHGPTGIIFTAGHCIPDSPFADTSGAATITALTHVEFSDGTEAPIAQVFTSDKNDVGMILIKASGIRPTAPVTFDPLQIAQQLFVIGSPADINPDLDDNTVPNQFSEAYSRDGDTPHTMKSEGDTRYIDCQGCTGGDSGAPVFNTDGVVTGMVVAGLAGQVGGMTVIIPSKAIFNSF